MKSLFSAKSSLTLMGVVALLCVPVQAKQLNLDVALAQPTMHIGTDDNKGENYLRIALTGFELPSEKERQPVNVCIVIDKSGSMQGTKIKQARKAALQALDRLGKNDIISVVTYDTSVSVVVPATKATDKAELRSKINSIQAGGNTALFAGVSKGAAEIRKFLDEKRVNRVILLSDGLANVGPSTPSELAQLGESLIKEGISVSTLGLGLGYNEDLMSKLALASSGNHVFIEDAENLVKVFQAEFDDVMSVVAQSIEIEATLAEGIRPVKVLNSKADISGQKVSIDLGQLYSRQERYFIVEVEVPFGEHESSTPLADVAVDYMNMYTETPEKVTSTVQVKFSNDVEIAQKDVDSTILGSCVIQIANERNRKATSLRDSGKIEEARKLLMQNGAYLDRFNTLYKIPELKSRSKMNYFQADNLLGRQWAATRKAMRESQVADEVQQRYSGTGTKRSTAAGAPAEGTKGKESEKTESTPPAKKESSSKGFRW